MAEPWRVAPWLLPLLAVAGAACGPSSNDLDTGTFAPDTTIIDSAGIRIVLNHGPAWPEGRGWTVDPVPEVDIGARDGDPRYNLYRAESAVLLQDGQVAVPNKGASEVFYYDRRGRFEAIVGGEGEGPGELRAINGMGPHPDGLFVTDGTSTILVFDSRHRLARDVRLAAASQDGLRFWPLGALADGSWIGQLRGPRTQRESRRTGVVWFEEAELARFSTDGAFLGEASEPMRAEMVMQHREDVGRALPHARAYGGHTYGGARGDRVYAGFNKDYSIRVYDPEFRLLRIVRLDRPPQKLSDADIERYARWTLELLGASRHDQVTPAVHAHLENHDYPETLPLFIHRCVVDDASNLWIPRGDAIYVPPSDRPTFRERWDVFDSAGIYLGDVVMPPGLEVHHVRGDRVVGRWRDELDVEHIRVHRIMAR